MQAPEQRIELIEVLQAMKNLGAHHVWLLLQHAFTRRAPRHSQCFVTRKCSCSCAKRRENNACEEFVELVCGRSLMAPTVPNSVGCVPAASPLPLCAVAPAP